MTLPLTDEQRSISETTRRQMREIIARYPHPRSALIPMLHLVQSERATSRPRASRPARTNLVSPQLKSRLLPRSTRCSSDARSATTTSVSAPTPCAPSWAVTPARHLEGPPRRRQRRDDRRRQGHPRARRVQRRLRLRARRHGQLGVLRQPDAGIGAVPSSTRCAPTSRSPRPVAPRASLPGARPLASSPVSTTAARGGHRRRADHRWLVSRLAHERDWTAPAPEQQSEAEERGRRRRRPASTRDGRCARR